MMTLKFPALLLLFLYVTSEVQAQQCPLADLEVVPNFQERNIIKDNKGDQIVWYALVWYPRDGLSVSFADDDYTSRFMRGLQHTVDARDPNSGSCFSFDIVWGPAESPGVYSYTHWSTGMQTTGMFLDPTRRIFRRNMLIQFQCYSEDGQGNCDDADVVVYVRRLLPAGPRRNGQYRRARRQVEALLAGCVDLNKFAQIPHNQECPDQ